MKPIDKKLQNYIKVQKNGVVKLTKNSNVYWLDWNHGSVCVLNERTNEILTLSNPFKLLDIIEQTETATNRAIVLETTFESFNLKNRNKFIVEAAEMGVELFSTPTRATARWRNNRLAYLIDDAAKPAQVELPFGQIVTVGKQTDKSFGQKDYIIEKSDINDVKIIRTLVLSGTALGHLKPHIHDDPWKLTEQAAAKTLVMLRNTKVQGIGKRGQPIKSMVSLKQKLSERLNDEYLDFSDDFWDETDQAMLGNAGTDRFNDAILAAVSVATMYTKNRAEFTKLAGMYHLAHPNMFRSEIYYYGMGNPDGKTARSRTWKEDGYTISDYTRSLRKLRRFLIDNKVPIPDIIDELMEI